MVAELAARETSERARARGSAKWGGIGLGRQWSKRKGYRSRGISGHRGSGARGSRSSTRWCCLTKGTRT